MKPWLTIRQRYSGVDRSSTSPTDEPNKDIIRVRRLLYPAATGRSSPVIRFRRADSHDSIPLSGEVTRQMLVYPLSERRINRVTRLTEANDGP
jgi:hypothetical protein